MSGKFGRLVEGLLHRVHLREEPGEEVPAPSLAPPGESAADRRKRWFACYAEEKVMPLLRQAAAAVETQGMQASCGLGEADGRLAAELVVVPPGLPEHAPPPRLIILADAGERSLNIEYTGTYPHAGATGGFGGEVDYDAVYPSQLEEKVLEFVALATGA